MAHKKPFSVKSVPFRPDFSEHDTFYDTIRKSMLRKTTGECISIETQSLNWSMQEPSNECRSLKLHFFAGGVSFASFFWTLVPYRAVREILTNVMLIRTRALSVIWMHHLLTDG